MIDVHDDDEEYLLQVASSRDRSNIQQYEILKQVLTFNNQVEQKNIIIKTFTVCKNGEIYNYLL